MERGAANEPTTDLFGSSTPPPPPPPPVASLLPPCPTLNNAQAQFGHVAAHLDAQWARADAHSCTSHVEIGTQPRACNRAARQPAHATMCLGRDMTHRTIE